MENSGMAAQCSAIDIQDLIILFIYAYCHEGLLQERQNNTIFNIMQTYVYTHIIQILKIV